MGSLFKGIGVSLALLVSGAVAQPNIIIILSDDAGYNEIGYTGTNEFLTPAIDSIAASGIRFTNAYVTQPTCGPSRAGLLTGLYQQSFGHEENVPLILNQEEGFQPGRITIAHRLKALGYTTGMIGKWHLGSKDDFNRPNDMGFDEFFGTLAGSRHYWGGEVDEWRRIRRQDQDIEAIWPFEGDQSQYDQTNGRYLTDAFGEEAVAFIDDHAAEPEPFFLFLSFTAPHQPYEAKWADLSQFLHLSGDQRVRAAMTLAMDRAVGNVLNALDDNQVAQDTIVIFYNDNGGTSDRDNSPLAGSKGRTWEGGVRVPACVRWPGMPQDVDFPHPIAAIDLVPTLVAAAGGEVAQTHGIDLGPFLSGQVNNPPHDTLYFRHRQSWAIRAGEWKLVRPDRGSNDVWLFNLDTDIGETTDLTDAQPDIAALLENQYTQWEATLDKMHWTSGLLELNRFDHFRYRALSTNSLWTNTDVWFKEDTSFPASMRSEDPYANAILEFSISSNNYTAANASGRATGLDFMLNRFEFTGTSVIDDPYQGTIAGLPVVMVPSLAGDPPTIEVTAITRGFDFRIQNRLQFLGPLQFTGDGNALLTITGPITEYLPGQSITKTGTHTVSLTNTANCTGEARIEQGLFKLAAPGATIASESLVSVFPAATLDIAHGAKVQAPLLHNEGRIQGRGFSFILADFLNATPEAVIAIALGDSGTGSEHDQMLVLGNATLQGRLQLSMDPSFVPTLGKSYPLLIADQLLGTFDTIEPPPEPTGVGYEVTYDDTTVWLHTVCAVDLTGDDLVNTRDFIAFLQLWSVEDPAVDWTRDGRVDIADFIRFLNLWSTCRS